MTNKKRHGGQTKEERMQARLSKMEDSLQKAILEGNEKIVNNYLNYLKVLDDAAMGTLKGVSPTNQISSAKVLIEKAEKLLEDNSVAIEKEEGNEVPDRENVSISLVPAHG
ncbi:conserved hypothetical protein [Vibrio phage 249E41-1]|nr:conserved hypothetical protein [Vibrio phage 249E41-1]CAH9017597.1 conserved hypothetical protein [Vibrio phage 193E37-1]